MAFNKRTTFKDHIREESLFRSRATLAVVFIFILLFMLIARMFYLQVINQSHYETLSLNNRVSVLPIAPPRGLIFDRNGVLLAQNIPSHVLEIVPEQITDMDDTLQRLGELIEFRASDLSRFNKQLKRTRRFKSLTLKTRLNEEEVARFAVNRHAFPGVEITARLIRDYPADALGVHAIGYVGRISERELQRVDAKKYAGSRYMGKTGVEKYYEDILHGIAGSMRVETNSQGRVLRVLDRVAPQPGKNLYLSLDSKVQAVAEKALGEERGAVVALDPKSGQIIALASMPGYDPNLFVLGLDNKTFSALRTSKARPLFNRALQGQYPPGSTVKPIIGLAGLEADVVHGSDHKGCIGWTKIKGDERKYRDWKKTGHGDTTLHKAIVESCDVYFYEMAYDLGIDRMSVYLKQFGFGRKTGIDIPGESSGLIPSREWKKRKKGETWFHGDTLITGIGQGYMLSTPLQLATTTATLANLGLGVEPSLLLNAYNPVTNQLESSEKKFLPAVEITKRENWDYVLDSMVDVVHSSHGSARGIGYSAKYKIAGKTGTAQVFGIKQDEEYVKEDLDKRLLDHALFVAFAPVEAPKIAIAVIVENGGGGGSTAAPIARKVMDAYLLEDENENR